MFHIRYDRSLKEKSRELRKNMTPAEKNFWNVLRTLDFFKRNRFNRQKPLGNFIVDFYSCKLDLVIEIDGDTHGTDKARNYDIPRTHWLENQGLLVIRFSNQDIFEKTDGVIQVLEKVVREREKDESPQPPLKGGA